MGRSWALLAGVLALAAGTAGADDALSPAASGLVAHVRSTNDAGGRPWAVVDKAAAQLAVFAADGRLLARTPVLLGLAPGDESAPGVGARAGRVPPAERTTAAGRFAAEPGRNLNGEAIVWLDYEAALAIHRLRPAPPSERRAERLASPTPADNRISAGCIVVDAGFYDRVVAPLLGRGPSVVYVLPESRGWRTLFAVDA